MATSTTTEMRLWIVQTDTRDADGTPHYASFATKAEAVAFSQGTNGSDVVEISIKPFDESWAACPECGDLIQWERTNNGVAMMWHAVHCGWGHQR